MESDNKSFVISLQTRLYYGNGSVSEIQSYLDSIGSNGVMLVCGPNFKSSSSYDKVVKALGPKLKGVYDKVESHPNFEVFYGGGQKARELKVDTVVSVGGGSSIDSGKGIALLKDPSIDLKDFLVSYDEKTGRKVKQYKSTPFKHVAIPTTYSSAETNGSAAVVDSSTKRKYILWSDESLPSAAFLDPELTESLPDQVSASSGMNTLAHCVETLYSVDLQPVSRSLALGALELIAKNIEKSIGTPTDINARGNLLLASSMAGYAYGNAVVSVHHAICHVLGAYYKIPHGTANSVMLPYVMKFMSKYVPDKVAEVARYLNISKEGDSDKMASEKAVRWVMDLRESLKVSKRLSELGVDKSDLKTIAKRTTEDWVAFQSIRKIKGEDEVEEILLSAY